MRFALIIVSIVFASSGMITSCTKQIAPGTAVLASVDLHSCKTVFFANNEILCLDSVLEDSRCPANALCIWQGTAVAKFTFTANDKAYSFTLSTVDLPGIHENKIILAGYKIEFLDLHPYPGLPGPLGSVKADVKVTKL